MLRRAVHEAPREDVDGSVEGRGEQHPLALRRGHVEQSPHDRQETEVGHVVRLVDHADLHIAEMAMALLDEIGQSAGTRDDIGPVTQSGHLRVLRATGFRVTLDLGALRRP